MEKKFIRLTRKEVGLGVVLDINTIKFLEDEGDYTRVIYNLDDNNQIMHVKETVDEIYAMIICKQQEAPTLTTQKHLNS